jgi:hypothetical protein
MGEYVDTNTSLLNRLAAMNTPIPDALAVIMFLSSLQGHFEVKVAAIRSLSDDNLTWDDDTSRLIEESSSPSSRTRQDSALAVYSRPICSFCGRQGHEANRCFTNPSNPNNSLGTSPSHPSSQRTGPNRLSAMVHAFDPNGPAFPPSPVQEDSPVPPPTATAAAQHPPGASHGRGPRSYHLLVSRATTAVLPDPSSAVASHILIDSVASAHMCPHREWFTQICPCAPCHILLWTILPYSAKKKAPFTVPFTPVPILTHFCYLIPSTLPRCAIHSFRAVRSLPRP